MLPDSIYDITEVEDITYETATYKLDLVKKRITGVTNSTDAMLQAIVKAMQTERFAYEIYSPDYGVELEALIGQDLNFVESVLEQRISEALLVDDRILEIADFTITTLTKDSLALSFTAKTIYGDIFYNGEAA